MLIFYLSLAFITNNSLLVVIFFYLIIKKYLISLFTLFYTSDIIHSVALNIIIYRILNILFYFLDILLLNNEKCRKNIKKIKKVVDIKMRKCYII